MVTIKVRITNRLETTQTLMIEPWTTEYVLPPGRTLDVIAKGDPRYPLEVELDEAYVTFTGFDSEGAIVDVFQNGVPATPVRAAPLPPRE